MAGQPQYLRRLDGWKARISVQDCMGGWLDSQYLYMNLFWVEHCVHQLQIWALALIVGKKHGQNQRWPKETAHPSYRHGALGGHTEGASEETGGHPVLFRWVCT